MFTILSVDEAQRLKTPKICFVYFPSCIKFKQQYSYLEYRLIRS
jgi:hypothetical protein